MNMSHEHTSTFMFSATVLLITQSYPLVWLLGHKCHFVHLDK